MALALRSSSYFANAVRGNVKTISCTAESMSSRNVTGAQLRSQNPALFRRATWKELCVDSVPCMRQKYRRVLTRHRNRAVEDCSYWSANWSNCMLSLSGLSPFGTHVGFRLLKPRVGCHEVALTTGDCHRQATYGSSLRYLRLPHCKSCAVFGEYRPHLTKMRNAWAAKNRCCKPRTNPVPLQPLRETPVPHHLE